MARYRPAECIVSSGVNGEMRQRIMEQGVVVTPFRDEAFLNENAFRCLTTHFRVASLGGYGCGESEATTGAAGAALAYAKETQFSDLSDIGSLSAHLLAEHDARCDYPAEP